MPREVEWEFSDSGGASGQFHATSAVVTNLRSMLAKGEMDNAVELYESCVDNVGDVLLADLPSSSSKLQRSLANLFYRARDYKRAAAACERLGEWEAAAKAYESAYAYDQAASCYLRMNDPRKAAAIYQKAGNHAKAAEIYNGVKDYASAAGALESSGDPLAAAQLFARLNDHRRAAQALAKIQANEPKYVPAMTLLAEVLVAMGRRDLAAQRLATALPRDGVVRDAATAELVYRLGGLLLEAGDAPRAVRVYEMLRAMNPPYKDVGARLAQAASLAGTVMPPPPSPPPLPQAPAVPVAPAHSGTIQVVGVSAPMAARTTATLQGLSGPTAPVAPSGGGGGGAGGGGGGGGPAGDPFASLDGNLFGSKGGGPQNPAFGLDPRGGPSPQHLGGPINRMEGYDLLKTLPIFEDLSLDEMKDFYNLCEPIMYEAGAVIIEQGQPGEALVIVREGNIRVTKRDGVGKDIPIATLGAGKYVGEMSLIDEGPTSARVIAADRVKALRIRKDAFQTYLFTHDLVALRVFRTFTRTLVQRLRETNARLAAHH
jgi:tetratricopeptide (TPR) repeat protein